MCISLRRHALYHVVIRAGLRNVVCLILLGRNSKRKTVNKNKMEIDSSSADGEKHRQENSKLTLPPHLQSHSGTTRNDKTYPNLMPYPIESLEEMDNHLERIIRHLLEAAQAKDFELLSHLPLPSSSIQSSALIFTSPYQCLQLLAAGPREMARISIPNQAPSKGSLGCPLLQSHRFTVSLSFINSPTISSSYFFLSFSSFSWNGSGLRTTND